ncbi:MAG: glycogen debranching enzyme family protein [Pedosphaera sp.]|nr:glycogen debranching enzyme family protein [Pedosphaera sp.]
MLRQVRKRTRCHPFLLLHGLFRRRRGEGPTLYPVACNPQAWSSAGVFFLIQAWPGLRFDAPAARVYFDNPYLPHSIPHLKIDDLKVASGVLDFSLLRLAENAAVTVRRRIGKVEVVVIH